MWQTVIPDNDVDALPQNDRHGFLSPPTMAFARILVCLTLCALVHAQSDADVSPHPVSFVPVDPSVSGPVSVNGLSSVPRPTAPVSVIGLSSVSVPAETAVSVHSLSFVPAPSLSGAPAPTSMAADSKSNKGKIAGGVVGALAVVLAAIGAFLFLRLRRRSTRHWRNRTTGTWQDREGKPSEGPVYVGQPLDRPFDGYSHDLKVPVASPTTPVFIREPRVAQSFSAPQRGHTRSFSSSHYRDDSIEMDANPVTH
ncbi:hypothetical protein DFH06DRAFT_1162402 [Mycena polygramma]|nr:hypothetical protein DFH06DRAFT_1162402 [Mycena polygramma]